MKGKAPGSKKMVAPLYKQAAPQGKTLNPQPQEYRGPSAKKKGSGRGR